MLLNLSHHFIEMHFREGPFKDAPAAKRDIFGGLIFTRAQSNRTRNGWVESVVLFFTPRGQMYNSELLEHKYSFFDILFLHTDFIKTG